MVSARCKLLVKDVLTKIGIQYTKVELGEVEIMEQLSERQYDQLCLSLQQSGLVVIDDGKSRLLQKIKDIIIELVYHSEDPLPINLSHYLSQQLNYDYTYLANIFSASQGVSIEIFFIKQKIERVKELLLSNKLTLTEIAYLMHYSSVAHLSGQFKKMTGLTPSHFKKNKGKWLLHT
jgi:AraC-like DNA-binding protein